MYGQEEEHLSSLLRISSQEEAKIIKSFFDETGLSEEGEKAFCAVLKIAQEHGEDMPGILQGLQEFLIGDLSAQDPLTRGNPRAPGDAGVINTAFLVNILEELMVDDFPLEGFPAEVPVKPFKMETFYGEVYCVGAEASDGARFIHFEDGSPLNFTRGRIPKLILGKSATILPLDLPPTMEWGENGELMVISFDAVLIGPIISIKT